MDAAKRVRATRTPPEERAAQIAAAARTLALAHGISALTLRNVAQEAGVTPALVAHYAGGMDSLVARCFSAITSEERLEVTGALGERSAPALVRLGGLIDAVLGGSREDVTRVWVEAWALGTDNELLAAATRAEMDAWHGALDLLLAEILRERGRAASGAASPAPSPSAAPSDPTESASLAWQILGMIDGLNAQSLVRWRSTLDRTALMKRAVEGMLRLPIDSIP